MTLLMTGDVETKGEQDLLRESAALHADVLKVPHHGSDRQDPRFVAAVGAKVALTSVGRGNPYGHPGAHTMRRLQANGVRSFRSDQDGSVASLGTAGGGWWPSGIRDRAGSGEGYDAGRRRRTDAEGDRMTTAPSWHARHVPDVPQLYLVQGDEDLLVTRALSELTQAAKAADPEAEIVDVSGKEVTDAHVMDLNSPSMFGTLRVLIIRQAQELPESLREAIAALRRVAGAGRLPGRDVQRRQRQQAGPGRDDQGRGDSRQGRETGQAGRPGDVRHRGGPPAQATDQRATRRRHHRGRRSRARRARRSDRAARPAGPHRRGHRAPVPSRPGGDERVPGVGRGTGR